MAKKEQTVNLEDSGSDSDCKIVEVPPKPVQSRLPKPKPRVSTGGAVGETPKHIQKVMKKNEKRLMAMLDRDETSSSGGFPKTTQTVLYVKARTSDTDRNIFEKFQPSMPQKNLVNLRKALQTNPELLAAVEGARSLGDQSQQCHLSREDKVLIKKLALLPLHCIELGELTEENQQIFLDYAVNNPLLQNAKELKRQFNNFLSQAISVNFFFQICVTL